MVDDEKLTSNKREDAFIVNRKINRRTLEVGWDATVTQVPDITRRLLSRPTKEKEEKGC